MIIANLVLEISGAQVRKKVRGNYETLLKSALVEKQNKEQD